MQKSFFFIVVISLFTLLVLLGTFFCNNSENEFPHKRKFNGKYKNSFLNKIAFPIGGIGAGMICLEGTGAISHVSVRNQMDFFNEPYSFAALCIKGEKNIAKVLEGPIPNWKIFGGPRTGRGADRSSYGLPRFDEASFLARFPFGTVTLQDSEIPLKVEIVGWSPFIPGDADNSSLPAGALEYRFKNNSSKTIEAVFSYNTKNFMKMNQGTHFSGAQNNGIGTTKNGFVLWQKGKQEHPEHEGAFAIFVDDKNTVVDHCWFRGGWWDPVTIAWKNIQEANLKHTPQIEGSAPGASLFVPFAIEPGAEKTIRLMFSWYVPTTNLRIGKDPENSSASCCGSKSYVPWYAGKFKNIGEIINYWRENYERLNSKTTLFRDTFYDTNLPDEVVEAVAANLTILKSPTVLRQIDGRLWCWEGCNDNSGCCSGSCTHVWNYAQAIPHLFPELERSLRETEFKVSQDEKGHQAFRSALPIRPIIHDFHSAADGQLGGIMKVYREWRISGDTKWLKSLYQQIKQSMNYCITTWDPKGKGILEEPHHNTYDIEYWGPNGHGTSFYLGALTAMIRMGKALQDDVSDYENLLQKGIQYMETELYDGEYFFQKIQWEGLETPNPIDVATSHWNINYSPEAIEILKKDGPKYQYGKGCLSDGVLGCWIAQMCGLGEVINQKQITSHLTAVHKYNLKQDLSDHVNPQRPSYALGKEGGLLLCTWPKGGKLTLPFVYSNEVWTGIEYQVASHLMVEGLVKQGLDIVHACRKRYDGKVRNPFNEYECGHWYARAMSSYGLIQGLTGVRYDAVDKTLFIDSKIGDNFHSFLATETGWGTVGLKNGKPFVDVKMGEINIEKINVSGFLVEL